MVKPFLRILLRLPSRVLGATPRLFEGRRILLPIPPSFGPSSARPSLHPLKTYGRMPFPGSTPSWPTTLIL